MTEERKAPQTAADFDALVSRTYHESAAEGAPDHLDRAVLQEAARAARPRYARFRTWTRPLAWAATIILSVALVLEVTKVPAPNDVVFDENLRKFDPPAPDPEKTDDVATEIFEESVLPETPSGRASNRAAEAPSRVAPMKSMSDEAAAEAAPERRQRLESLKIKAEAQEGAAPELTADEFEFSDKDIVQRAEDMARMQSEDDREAGLEAVPAAAVSREVNTLGVSAVTSEVAGCDDAARAAPETWLECIAELEQAGLVDEAAIERESLSEAFPDFSTR
jgi:hypothetical protein